MTPRLQKIRIDWNDDRLMALPGVAKAIKENPDITPDDIFETLVANDPTKTGKFVGWLLKAWESKDFQWEDIKNGNRSQIHQTMRDFETFKRMKGSDKEFLIDEKHRSIMVHNGPQALWQFMMSIPELKSKMENDGPDTESNRHRKKMASLKAHIESLEYRFNDGVKMTIPMTAFASQFFGRNTKWCTTEADGGHFRSYSMEGPLMIFTLPDGTRFQGHINVPEEYSETSDINDIDFSFMNEADLEPNEEENAKLAPYRKGIMAGVGMFLVRTVKHNQIDIDSDTIMKILHDKTQFMSSVPKAEAVKPEASEPPRDYRKLSQEKYRELERKAIEHLRKITEEGYPVGNPEIQEMFVKMKDRIHIENNFIRIDSVTEKEYDDYFASMNSKFTMILRHHFCIPFSLRYDITLDKDFSIEKIINDKIHKNHHANISEVFKYHKNEYLDNIYMISKKPWEYDRIDVASAFNSFSMNKEINIDPENYKTVKSIIDSIGDFGMAYGVNVVNIPYECIPDEAMDRKIVMDIRNNGVSHIPFLDDFIPSSDTVRSIMRNLDVDSTAEFMVRNPNFDIKKVLNDINNGHDLRQFIYHAMEISERKYPDQEYAKSYNLYLELMKADEAMRGRAGTLPCAFNHADDRLRDHAITASISGLCPVMTVEIAEAIRKMGYGEDSITATIELIRDHNAKCMDNVLDVLIKDNPNADNIRNDTKDIMLDKEKSGMEVGQFLNRLEVDNVTISRKSRDHEYEPDF